mgnify:CR=1 FL=1
MTRTPGLTAPAGLRTDKPDMIVLSEADIRALVDPREAVENARNKWLARECFRKAGLLTPDWWSPRNTQYGLLKVWHVNGQGSKVDGAIISDVTIDALKLKNSPYISARIGVKGDANYVGGINLFGSRFGNYPQDLVLRIGYGSTVQPPRSGSGNP